MAGNVTNIYMLDFLKAAEAAFDVKPSHQDLFPVISLLLISLNVLDIAAAGLNKELEKLNEKEMDRGLKNNQQKNSEKSEKEEDRLQHSATKAAIQTHMLLNEAVFLVECFQSGT